MADNGNDVQRPTVARCAFGIVAAAILASTCNAVTAFAAALPDVTGQKYSDASSTISGAGMTPVVSTTVGDRKAWPDCLVTNVVQRTKKPPANTQGSAVNQVLVSLNCNAGVASATTPGLSAGSPQGRAAAAAAAASTPTANR